MNPALYKKFLTGPHDGELPATRRGRLAARYPGLRDRLHRKSSSGSTGTRDISFFACDLNGLLKDLDLQGLAAQGTLKLPGATLRSRSSLALTTA